MEYIKYIKSKAQVVTGSKNHQPVLTTEDEEFLNRITSDENPPPLPIRTYKDHGGDAQLALLDGAHNIPLPPEESEDQIVGLSEEPATLLPDQSTTAGKPKRKTWTWLRRDSRDAKSRKQQTASDLHDLAQSVKPADAQPNEDGEVSDEEAKKEEEDMAIVLEKLNLAAVNNRVFSVSDETQELLQQFNQVFKDLIQGVPTAYNDLESLLTNGDRQLQKTFGSLPPFLQKLIEKLPETMTKGFAPEIMAAATERATKAGINMEHAGKAAGVASKIFKTPSLKELVAKPSAIAGMLRSIITFLRARFPAFLGMNVLWSLALFVLLFVFWYCYKRGKETRLEKERVLTEQEVERLEAEYRTKFPQDVYMTTAEPGAPIDEVRAGVQEVEARRAAQAASTRSPNSQVINYTPSKAAHTRRLSTSH